MSPLEPDDDKEHGTMNENTSSAAEQLRAVHAGSRVGIDIGRAGRVQDALYGTAVGVLIAGMLAVVVFVYPTRVPWLIVPSTVLYGVGIGVTGAIYRMRRKGTSRISAKRYRIGFLVTISLYAIGVVLSVLGLALPVWFWIPFIVATALPMVITSNLGVPRDR
jgi:peptidoglycan/LPS O-acetylase OafA/YrhL